MPTPGTLPRYVDAWQGGDVDTLLSCYADALVLHYGGTSEFAGDHAGRDAAIAVLAETSARTERVLVAVDALFDDGVRGALFVREALTVGGSRVEVARSLRFRFEAAQIAEVWLYDHDQHLVDAAWGAGRPA